MRTRLPKLVSYNRRSDYSLTVSAGQGFRSDYAGWFWGLPLGGPSRSGDGAEVLRVQCVFGHVLSGQKPQFPTRDAVSVQRGAGPRRGTQSRRADTAVSCDRHFCVSLLVRGETLSLAHGHRESRWPPLSREEGPFKYGATFKQPSGNVGRRLWNSDAGFTSHT